MKVIRCVAAFWLLTIVMCAQEKSVPVGEEGHHHPVLENEYTRVFHVVVAPHESTLIHQHDRDYVWVQIGPADVMNSPVGKAATEVKLTDGQVKFTKGEFAHKVTNVADTPFVNVTIEVKKPSTKAICGASWAGAQEARSQTCGLSIATGIVGQTYELETDEVEAHTFFTAGSGTGMTPQNAETPRLLVAITPLHCFCGGTQDLNMQPGDIAWIPKGTIASTSRTSGGGPRFVIVGFK